MVLVVSLAGSRPFTLLFVLGAITFDVSGLMPPQGPAFQDIMKRQIGAPGVPNSTPNTQAPPLGFNNLQQQSNQQSAVQAQMLPQGPGGPGGPGQGPQSQPLPSPQFSSPPPAGPAGPGMQQGQQGQQGPQGPQGQQGPRMGMPPTPTSQDGHIPNPSMLVSSSPSPGLTPTSNGLPGGPGGPGSVQGQGPQVSAAAPTSLSSQSSLSGLGLMTSTTVTAPNSVPTPGSTVSTNGTGVYFQLNVGNFLVMVLL